MNKHLLIFIFFFMTLFSVNYVNINYITNNDMISSFSSYVVLIIGVVLAGVVLELIIGAIRHKIK
jgi:TRAP-type C4-dicarboxylate transport system permease small subunit